MSEMSNTIWTKSNGTVSVIGSYKQNADGQSHAIIRNLRGYRTLCETYTNLYFAERNAHIHSRPFHDVTCKKCLRIIDNSKRVTRLTQPPKQKKFFLVSYSSSGLSRINSLVGLRRDIKNSKKYITNILLVESYRTISTKEILVITDENGNEITENDI